MEDRKKAVLFISAGLLCFAVAWGLVRGFSGRWPWGAPTGVAGPSWSVRQAMNTPGETETGISTAPGKADPVRNAEKWVVYLTGEVQRPGIVEISPDSRLYQAVEMAGGLTARADRENINLAEKVSDGSHFHIPAVGQATESEKKEKQPPSAEGSPATPGNGRIDVNHATASELEALPGVGPKLAQAIIEDRTTNGPFRTPEDLLRVKGIGPAKLEKMKEMILIRP